MKKNIYLVLVSLLVFTACSTEETTVAESVETLPVSVLEYVAQNYADTKIVSATQTGTETTVTLNTGETLTVSSSGKVTAYSNNYSAGLMADSLKADSVHHRKHHGKSHGHKRHFKNEVAVDSLSTAITDYVAANYAGYSVIHAQIDTICQGVVTRVMLCLPKTEPVKLAFDASGVYLFKSVRIKYSTVPALISDAVASNYADYTAMNRAGLRTYPDSVLQYVVFLKQDSIHRKVVFNADGTVNCEK